MQFSVNKAAVIKLKDIDLSELWLQLSDILKVRKSQKGKVFHKRRSRCYKIELLACTTIVTSRSFNMCYSWSFPIILL